MQPELIGARVRQIKDGGAIAAVSSIPQRAAEFGAIAQEAGADVFVVQSTVSTVRHISSEYKSLDLGKILPGDADSGDRRQHRRLRCHVRNHGMRPGGRSGWSRAGSGLHFARGARPGRAAGHGHGRLRGRARCLFQKDRALCPDHHRRRDEQRRGCLQGARLRGGCRDGGKRVCQSP